VTAAQRPIPSNFGLTRRELDVLTLMSEGRRNSEIALHLAVSRSTIKKHVSSILYKLNTTSRTEAVSVAIQNHIVRL
jgi:NarL family two-component system response regulator LiaR